MTTEPPDAQPSGPPLLVSLGVLVLFLVAIVSVVTREDRAANSLHTFASYLVIVASSSFLARLSYQKLRTRHPTLAKIILGLLGYRAPPEE